MKGVHAIILLSVAITAAAQLILKAGMTNPAVQRLIDQSLSVRQIGILFDPYVFGGLFLYFGAAVMWLFVLARFEVSYAYPFVALGFVITALAGWALFDDTMSPGRALGTLMICAGVVLVARS